MNLNEVFEQVDQLYREKKGEAAERLMRKYISQAIKDEDDASLLQLMNELLGYYRETSQIENSFIIADQTIALTKKMGLEGTLPYATTLLNVANAYRAGGKLEESLQRYNEVQQIYGQKLAPDNMLMASLQNNLSLLHQEMGDFREAKTCLLRALPIVKAKSADFEVAVTYANLASTCMSLDETDEANLYAEEAIKKFDELGVKDAHYGAALSAKGTFYFKKGEYETAIEIFKEALEIVEAKLGQNEYYFRLKDNIAACEEEIEKQKKAQEMRESLEAAAQEQQRTEEAEAEADATEPVEEEEELSPQDELDRYLAQYTAAPKQETVAESAAEAPTVQPAAEPVAEETTTVETEQETAEEITAEAEAETATEEATQAESKAETVVEEVVQEVFVSEKEDDDESEEAGVRREVFEFENTEDDFDDTEEEFEDAEEKAEDVEEESENSEDDYDDSDEDFENSEDDFEDEEEVEDETAEETAEEVAGSEESVEVETEEAATEEAATEEVATEATEAEEVVTETKAEEAEPEEAVAEEAAPQPVVRKTDGVKGLDLCREYYEAYGKPMIEEKFPFYVNRIAVGLVGEGSDCFGYDDEISRDHDWGPDFCLWVSDETYLQIGQALEDAYKQLPTNFRGYQRTYSEKGQGRRGVRRISDFYKDLLQTATYEEIDWRQVSDASLAAAVNGEVFRDGEGLFTEFRTKLQKGYPDNIRQLKIADSMARFSQTGQYNFTRVLKRGDKLTSQIMLADCMREAMKLQHYVEGTYPPHDKWLYSSIQKTENGQKLAAALEKLQADVQKDFAANEAVICEDIETIASFFSSAMYQKSIISDSETYLDEHTDELVQKSFMTDQTEEELIDKIITLEYEAFDKVQNEGGRAACQDDWNTFSIMRKSQYMTWNREMLTQYLYDFEREFQNGHNLIEEKYGRMMESTAPEEYEKIKDYFPVITPEKQAIIDEIVPIQVGWMEDFSKQYPYLAYNARSIGSGSDSANNTSFETYLRGEISTYSDKMLELYGRFVVDYSKQNKNLTLDTMENSVRLYGYGTLESAESFMKYQNF